MSRREGLFGCHHDSNEIAVAVGFHEGGHHRTDGTEYRACLPHFFSGLLPEIGGVDASLHRGGCEVAVVNDCHASRIRCIVTESSSAAPSWSRSGGGGDIHRDNDFTAYLALEPDRVGI